MNKQKLLSALHNGTVGVRFRKVNSKTERHMTCTLKSDFLPKKEDTSHTEQNPDVCVVWDVEKDGWRSFRWDSIIDWVGEAA